MRPSPPPGGLTALTHLEVLQFGLISPGPLNVRSQRWLAQSGVRNSRQDSERRAPPAQAHVAVTAFEVLYDY